MFLIDGIGALGSAIILGLVLGRFEQLFGMPEDALMMLAAMAVGFSLYDVIAYLAPGRHTRVLLRGISLLNVGYWGVSVALLVWHANQMTNLGWFYVLGESLIVLFLARTEWKASTQ